MPLTYQGFLQPGPMAPWARIGDNILVKRVQKYVLYKVLFEEQIPYSSPMIIDLIANSSPVVASIAGNATLPAQSLQVPLEMDGWELGQFRVKILSDIELQVYEPQNLPRFFIKQARARFSKLGQVNDPYQAQSELAVFQDEYPYVDVINPRDYTIVQARVAFYGYRYRLAQLDAVNGINEIKDTAFTAVMAEGFVGTGYQRPGIPIVPGPQG